MAKNTATPLPYPKDCEHRPTISTVSEQAFTKYLSATDGKILSRNGVIWRETIRGFYEPVHWLKRLSAAQASKPITLAWGSRAVLEEKDRETANGFLPVHLLQDVASYDLTKISSRRRGKIRKSFREDLILNLSLQELVSREGFQVYRSAARRTAFEQLLSKAAWIESLKHRQYPSSLIIGGVIDGKLAAYLLGFAVGSIAYIDEVRIATEFFKSEVGSGIVFEFVQACRRSGKISEIAYGLHSREDENLCFYKEQMRFPVVKLPTRVSVNPLLKPLLRTRFPNKYYRLTGIG